VRLSRVQARRSPITGAIVVAEVVLHGEAPAGDALDELKVELLERCRRGLKPHKVPASLRFVPTIELTPAGKLVRPSG
jgi:acyl-coenzyme A synthetase/AMP-(fatty) acid ligase